MREVELGDLGLNVEEQELLARSEGRWRPRQHRTAGVENVLNDANGRGAGLSWVFAVIALFLIGFGLGSIYQNDVTDHHAQTAAPQTRATPPVQQQTHPAAEAVARYNHGIRYRNGKQYTEAAAAFAEAITLNANWGNAWEQRGYAYLQLRQYDDAIRDFDNALRLRADPDTYRFRGETYTRLGKYQRAIKDFTAAIRLKGSDAFPYLQRGLAHQQLKQFLHAIADYDQAIERDPQLIEAYNRRAQAQKLLENYWKEKVMRFWHPEGGDRLPFLGGVWKGQVAGYEAELCLVQERQRIWGGIDYAGVEENVDGTVDADGNVFLKGIARLWLDGQGEFELAAFSGRLSADKRTISGTFESQSRAGSWSMTKGFEGSLGEASVNEDAHPPIQRDLSIESVNPWTDTGIGVRKGDVVTITATGLIHSCRWNNCQDARFNRWVDARGFVDLPHLSGFPSMALIGSIGNSAFLVGTSANVVSSTDGNLYLGINDIPDSFSDNAGRLTVRVIVQSPAKP